MAVSVPSKSKMARSPLGSVLSEQRNSSGSERLKEHCLVPNLIVHIELPNSFLSVGKYRNKFTDAVDFKIRTTANTNVVHFNGKLLALKEDAPPYALDPHTLETSSLYDFDGQLPSLTFTAHPKFDPRTGEMVCFGYEAKGDGTPDICYYRIAADGKFLETVWLTAPVVAMIHDFAVTENWVSSDSCIFSESSSDIVPPCYLGPFPRHPSGL
mgnify:FL=1